MTILKGFAQAVAPNERIGDVIAPANPEDEPCCGILT